MKKEVLRFEPGQTFTPEDITHIGFMFEYADLHRLVDRINIKRLDGKQTYTLIDLIVSESDYIYLTPLRVAMYVFGLLKLPIAEARRKVYAERTYPRNRGIQRTGWES